MTFRFPKEAVQGTAEEDIPFKEKPTDKEGLINEINEMMSNFDYYVNGGFDAIQNDITTISHKPLNDFTVADLSKLFDLVKTRA